jgi:hypothetical protein
MEAKDVRFFGTMGRCKTKGVRRVASKRLAFGVINTGVGKNVQRTCFPISKLHSIS